MKLNFWKKESQDLQLTNEDWLMLSEMMFRQVNRDQAIPKFITMSDYIRLAFAYNPTVYSLIMWRANAAKGIPWLVYKVTNKAKFRQYAGLTRKDINLHKVLQLKEEALEEVEGTPLNILLKKPNPFQSFEDLVEELFVYRDTTGNAYTYGIHNPVTKTPAQLFSLPADKVEIIGDTWFNPIKGYRFDKIKGDLLPKEQVIHWKYINPTWDNTGRQLYGLSPLVAAARIINNDNMGIDSQNSAFLNEGVKGVITGTDNENIAFTPEQGELLRKKFEVHLKMAKAGRGNIAFNRAPLNYLKIGETPVDLGIMEARRYNKEILCNLFRVHPSLLSSEASTLNNMEEARKSLMTSSVLPDLDGLRSHLNNYFKRYFGEEYFVDYDIMAIAELQDDIETLGKTLQGMDWVTANEKRTMTNYEAYDNPAADVIYQDMGKIPLGFNMDSGYDEIDENLKTINDKLD